MDERTRLRRLPELQVDEREALYAVLDSGRVAHVGITDAQGPVVLPVAYARVDDSLVLHGSTGSRLFRTLADGAQTCATVTLLDGLVLARSAFESSMNYRSAMVFGRCREVTDKDAKEALLRRFTESQFPGRLTELRDSSPKEFAATLVLELPIEQWSLKVSSGGPEDSQEDIANQGHLWAGVVPIVTEFGEPRPDEQALGVATPPYVSGWTP